MKERQYFGQFWSNRNECDLLWTEIRLHTNIRYQGIEYKRLYKTKVSLEKAIKMDTIVRTKKVLLRVQSKRECGED